MDKFIDKKILILAKETFSYPLYFLTKRWKENNTLGVFFFMPAECKYAESLLNSTTYYAYKRMAGIKIYDVADIADQMTENLKNPPVDWEYLSYVEKNFTHFKGLNIQLMSSQFTTSNYHYRNYMHPFTHEQKAYWLEVNYKRIIEIMSEFKPDIIIDFEDAELPRSIINEVAYKGKIPYITLDYPRYKKYKIFTYQMGIGIDNYFKLAYNEFLAKPEHEFSEEYSYIDEYRAKQNIMPEEFKHTITAQYEKSSMFTTVKILFGKVMYFWNQDSAGDNRKIKKKNKLLYPNSQEYIKFYTRVELLKRKLLSKNKYFEEPVESEQYVYMPLHLIPESTTFVKAPIYVNELSIIEAVSKSLPIGWKLYVKEHQAMLGERSVEFYKQVKRFPNVRLVQVNYYNDPKPWINNAQAVITITGTSAFEAALLGKPSIVFADVPFSLISSIHRVDSFEQLEGLFRSFQNTTNFEKGKHSCAAYIATVKKYGIDFEHKYLMSEGEKILFGKSEISEKYEQELDKLELFYKTAYDLYQKSNC